MWWAVCCGKVGLGLTKDYTPAGSWPPSEKQSRSSGGSSITAAPSEWRPTWPCLGAHVLAASC